MKIFFKKTSNFSCRIKIEVVVLHPLPAPRLVVRETRKKIRHVPRHIELTAVLRRDSQDKRIRVIELRDFKKTTRPSVKNK